MMSIKSYFKGLFKKNAPEPMKSIPFSQLPGVSSTTTTWKGLSPNQFGSLPVYMPGYIDQKIIDDQTIILNSFENNVKVLYQEIKPHIGSRMFFSDLTSDIEVCQILEKHLRNNKFNNTLEDLINE